MLVVPSVADTNIQKADTVKLKPKESRWQAVRFRVAKGDTGKNKNAHDRPTDESTRSALVLDNTISTCNSTRPSLQPAHGGCMKVRTQTDSICRKYPSSSSSSNESSSSRPNITFSVVAFHTHAIVLGDNPAVSVGPPLAMSWKAVESVSLDLEEYETSRPPRRQKRDLIVPRTMRMDWLRDEGYSRHEVAEVENEIKVIKKYRQTNAHKGLWDKVRESVLSKNDKGIQGDDDSVKIKRSRRLSYQRKSSYDVLIGASLSKKKRAQTI
jgi:hypothetical protein